MADLTIAQFCAAQRAELAAQVEEVCAAIDAGIAHEVRVLMENGVETFESCEGSPGHAFTEPTVRFHGPPAAGFHALSVAMAHALPVASLRRCWVILDGEPTGPQWEMTFSRAARSASQGGGQ